MNELLKFKGRLLEKQQAEERLKLRMKSLVDTMRNQLDPFADLSELPGQAIAQNGFDLAKLQIELSGIQGEIAAIKKALGETD